MRYFISDLHFGHYSFYTDKGITTFERKQFKSIAEHDDYLGKVLMNLSRKLTAFDEVWNLGDFGCIDRLGTMDWLRQTGAKVYFVYGNHDKQSDRWHFERHFDQVFLYPVYLSQKLVVSHYPVAVWGDTINVHGHLHGAKLCLPQYINASIHVANYQPISEKYVNSRYAQLPKFTRRFMYEPFAQWYQFTQPKEDVIMDPDGIIDLSASRTLQRINTERRIQEKDSYQPYHGEGSFND